MNEFLHPTGRARRHRSGHLSGRSGGANRAGVAAGGGVLRPPRPYRVAGHLGQAADLRRFLARHAKSNRIDAETLARLPLVAPHWADRGRVRQPRSWESACITVEEVAEAAAVPVLDELRGRAVEMYVALKPGYTPSKEIEQKVTKALECSAPSVRRLPSTTPETRGRRESA